MSLVGERIGNYVLERILARGGMGEIYIGRHPHLERSVAVKILPQGAQPNEALRARFFDEAKITAQLKHPHIIDLFDFGEFDGHLYYLMELLEGCDLCRYLEKNGPLAVPEAIDFLLQICEGLACAHAAGAVHRDLKPANVFVQSAPHRVLKLMDFGIAKLSTLEGSITSHGQVLGTPAYMAPEQALGQTASVTPQSDLYALGAIAYELLTGAPPFCHESPIMVLIQHVHEPPPPLVNRAPHVPPPLIDLIHRCLEKDPARRPPSARSIADALKNMAGSVASASAARSEAPALTEPASFTLPESAPEPEPVPPAREELPAESDFSAIHLSQEDRDVLKRLYTRMQRRGDMPAFGANVGEVNARADHEGRFSAHELSEAILKDCALTSRLLRVVNSLHASRVAGRVYSIRQAIVILGFERVRSLAVSISVFGRDSPQNRNPLAEESALMALTSGELARETALRSGLADPEQAMISGMFRNLGRHLLIVYLPELYEQVQAKMAKTGQSEDITSQAVLGISLRKLGLGIALKWNLPARVTESMSVECRPEAATTPEQRLALLSNFASELSNLIASTTSPDGNRELEMLLARYEKILRLTVSELRQIFESAGAALQVRHSSLLHRKFAGSPFLTKLTSLAHPPKAPDPGGAPAQPGLGREQLRVRPDRAVKALALGSAKRKVPDSPLTQNLDQLIHELQAATDPRVALQDIFSLFRSSLGSARVLVLGVPESGSVLRVLGGAGSDIGALRTFLTFECKRGAHDVFSRALSQERDVLIRDAFSKRSAAMIPRAYYEVIGASSFFLYYVGKMQGKSVLLLADWGETELAEADGLLPSLEALRPKIHEIFETVGLERMDVGRDVEVPAAAL